MRRHTKSAAQWFSPTDRRRLERALSTVREARLYRRIEAVLLVAEGQPISDAAQWPCPGLTDTPDRLNGLRGVDGGEQQTAPVLPGRIQARGGGGCPRWPLGFGGGGRVGPAGSAGPSLAALGGGPHGGRERCAGADAHPAAGGAGTPRGPEPGGPRGGDRAAAA